MTSCRPIWHKYKCQSQAQPAFIEVDEEGEIEAKIDYVIGNGVPEAVWHGRAMRFYVANTLSDDEIERIIEKIRPIVDEILAESEVVWNGNNHGRRFTEKGEELRSALEYKCSQYIGNAEPCYDTKNCEYCREAGLEMYRTDDDEEEES